MPVLDIHLSRPAARSAEWLPDFFAVMLATLAAFATHVLDGFPSLSDSKGDNDALMRLVQVRDLIGGQGWFDMTQYRMGLEGGFAMHWSRLVDALIAALTLAATFLTDDPALGETIAAVFWPLLLYAAALLLIVRAARRLGGERALLPALVIGAITMHASALFLPGSLDHHSVQLVLTLALVTCLLAEADDQLAAYGAGAAAALMLAVGMETLPYVAIGGVCVAGKFLLEGASESRRAARFGAAFATTSLCAFFLTAPGRAWLAAQCDAFSVAQVSLATVAGLGLWSVATLTRNGAVHARAAWLAGLGGLVGATAILAFPQCMADPFAELDPRLRTYWLDGVKEAQSFADLMAANPAAEFAGYYGTPLLGLFVLATRIWRMGIQRQDAVIGSFLAGAILVSFWQVRGSVFSLPLAVLPLAAWVSDRRMLAEAIPTPARTIKLMLAWLLSFNLLWYNAASAAGNLIPSQSAEPPAVTADAENCYRAADYGRLAALPKGTVVAISNLGASILAYTPHRVLAGPYHRNVAGNLTTLDALMGPISKAREVLNEAGVDFIVSCPGNSESQELATWSPKGLEAALRGGDAPAWLHPVPGNDREPLKIYRLRSSGEVRHPISEGS